MPETISVPCKNNILNIASSNSKMFKIIDQIFWKSGKDDWENDTDDGNDTHKETFERYKENSNYDTYYGDTDDHNDSFQEDCDRDNDNSNAMLIHQQAWMSMLLKL